MCRNLQEIGVSQSWVRPAHPGGQLWMLLKELHTSNRILNPAYFPDHTYRKRSICHPRKIYFWIAPIMIKEKVFAFSSGKCLKDEIFPGNLIFKITVSVQDQNIKPVELINTAGDNSQKKERRKFSLRN